MRLSWCTSCEQKHLPALSLAFLHAADSSTEITARPQPTEKEIQFILDAIAEYLQVSMQKGTLNVCSSVISAEP